MATSVVFAWLILIPATLGNIILMGLIYLVVSNFGMSNVVFLIVIGIINWVLLFGFIRFTSSCPSPYSEGEFA